MQIYLTAFIVALGVTYLVTPSVKRLAVRWGAVDKPDARKVHKGIIPRLGGLAIYAGFIVSVLLSVHLTWELLGILLGGTAILLLGVVDDIYQLPAKVKLVGQIAAACVLLLFDIKIDWLTNPFGSMIYLDFWAIPFTVLWVVSLTNMLNLIDGLDGLAAGVSTIAAVTIFLMAVDQHFWLVAMLTAALAGSALGFLHFNFSPAKIFMGDTGSMFLGYMLAAVSVAGTVKSAATIALIVPMVALGLPIMDTACAIIRRFNNGQPIFKPDRGHLHHRLLDMGLTQTQVVLILYLVSIILGVSAIAMTEVKIGHALIIIVGLLAAAFIAARKTGVLKNAGSVKGR
jgi:UDP-GlcNAc:undecaprenyl-phosphate/decaprenyl-phosphate GlcNAc-1-phosphate transferase